MIRRLLMIVGLLLVAISTQAREEDPPPGEVLYRQGRLSSGAALRGVLQGDVEVRGAAASCAQCHRPSGYGSNEGATIVPPITGRSLFQPRQTRRADMIRGLYQDPLPDTLGAVVRTPRDRPAYNRESLAVALRAGIDPAGRKIDPMMPRYDLNEVDLSALIAYLKTLAAESDPGVDDRNLHLATVISTGVDPARRRALLSVLESFVRTRACGQI